MTKDSISAPKSVGPKRTRAGKKPVPRFRQKTLSLGLSHFNVDKALQFAAELEDEEILRKMREDK